MKRLAKKPYRGVRWIVNRYLDTVLYILILITLVVLTVNIHLLRTDILALEKLVEEKVEPEIVIIDEPHKDDGSLYGDDTEAVWPQLYTDEDVVAIAKMLWGEARGVPELNGVSTKCQQAATAWTVLNRYDAGYENSIAGVIKAPYQYVGYSESNPIDEDLVDLALDVLDRWNSEKHGETDVGRVLPSDYMWFRGDGRNNYFRNEYSGKTTWDWSLEDIYGE